MKQDGGLRAIFRANLREAQWTSIETGGTAGGVPDCEFCFPGGVQGWIECKLTRAWAVKVKPSQVGWIGRRSRLRGRVFVATRRICRGEDELYLHLGDHLGGIRDGGIRAVDPLGYWYGGPSRWNWGEVRALLVR